MTIKTFTFSSILIAAVLLLAINIFSNAAFTSARADLTENNIYTLSKGTQNILEGLQEPVTVRLYLSQKLATRLPGISSYANRVKELLQQYQRTAGDNINLSIIDPEPFSKEEDQAVAYGLKGVPLNDGESTFYFGMVATGPTDEETQIPFFSPQRQEFVEYDITKAIQQVANPKKKVVGLISSISIDGSPAPHMPGMGMPRPTETWTVVAQMRDFFEVRSLDIDIDKVPDDVDVLMLVHPKGLSDATLYAIDQFVLGGGRLLAFVDPQAETDELSNQQSGLPGRNFGSSDLNKLTKSWGVKTTDKKVVGDIQLAQKVAFNVSNRSAAIDYPVWMKITKQNLNSKDIITSQLGTINVASPGAITVTKTDGIKVTPLIETTDKATEFDKSQLRLLGDPQDLLRNYKPSGQSYILAARITGKAKSAFPDGKPQSSSDDNTSEDGKKKSMEFSESLKQSKGDINVILVADTDMLEDRFWVRMQNLFGSRMSVPVAANGSFVINALDNLTGSKDLISVRNRGLFSRPFTKVDELRQQAELKYREKEQKLMRKLRQTERKLAEMQRGKSEDKALILSNEQRMELEQFRQERVKIRKELREVRHQLQKNIDSLEGWLKFINIGLIPLIIAIGGGIFGIIKMKKRDRSTHTPAAA